MWFTEPRWSWTQPSPPAKRNWKPRWPRAARPTPAARLSTASGPWRCLQQGSTPCEGRELGAGIPPAWVEACLLVRRHKHQQLTSFKLHSFSSENHFLDMGVQMWMQFGGNPSSLITPLPACRSALQHFLVVSFLDTSEQRNNPNIFLLSAL